MNTTATKPSNNGTTTNTAAAAQAFGQQATDTVKTNMEAGQKMFNTFTETFTKGFNMNAFNANPFAFNPFTAPAVTVPAAFEKMTKAMHGVVEANARLVTEMGTMAVETMKNNARTMERTGEIMVGQITGKSTKPVIETAREVYDEANTFNTKMVERVTKLNTEHAQRVTAIMDETMTCKTGCTNN